jgi:hypothetical protein
LTGALGWVWRYAHRQLASQGQRFDQLNFDLHNRLDVLEAAIARGLHAADPSELSMAPREAPLGMVDTPVIQKDGAC